MQYSCYYSRYGDIFTYLLRACLRASTEFIKKVMAGPSEKWAAASIPLPY